VLLFLLAKFYEDAVGGFGVEEADEFVVGAVLGCFVQQFETERGQPFHFGFNILYFERDVVDAFALFVDEFGNGAVLVGSLEELDLRFAGAEKGGADALGLHYFFLVAGGIEELFVQGN
jgi:hypothetical protein